MTDIKYGLKKIYLFFRGLFIRSLPDPPVVTKIEPQSVSSIVVIRTDRIGDVIVSLPAIKALKDMYPKSRIAVVLRPENMPILKGISWIDELIPYEGLVRTAKILREKDFYMAVDLLMDYSLRSAILAFLSKAKITAGFDIEGRGRLFNLALIPAADKRRMGERILGLVRLLGRISGIDADNIRYLSPRIPIPEQDRRLVDEFLQKNGIGPNDIILGIHPGGRYPSQRWMPERFAELADKVSRRYGARPVIIGSPEEKELMEGIASTMKIKPLLISGFTLDKLASVIARMKILVCNNSGPLHIAAALGIQTLSTMGPTDPDLWQPDGEGHIVIRHGLPCAPCNYGTCKIHECMRSITVDEMERAADILMKGTGRGASAMIPGGFRNILIINLGGIGDILLSTPALKAIRNRYPDTRISLAVVPRAYEIVKDMPYIDEVFLLDTSLCIGRLWDGIKTIAILRTKRFDIAVNMRTLVSGISALKIRLLLGMIGPRMSAGRDTDGRGSFFDIKVHETILGEKCEIDYDIDMARSLGAEVTDRTIDIRTGEADTRNVERMLKDSGVIPEDILVNIHIGGKSSHQWPAGNYFELMEKLNKEISCKFLITGSGKDRRNINGLMEKSGAGIIDMMGRLTFRELAALIKMCRICVCNDTGPMHVAAALGTPLIAIFGPGYLKRFDPRNISDKAVVLYKKASCAPCDKPSCSSLKCLRSITVQEVMDKCLEMLKAAKT